MKRNWFFALCLCLVVLTACRQQPEQPNGGVQPRNLTEQQAAQQRAGAENGLADLCLPYQTFRLMPLAHPQDGTPEAMTITIRQAEQQTFDTIQQFLDSLQFETADYSQWVGDDLARAMEGEYCLLEIDTAQYFVSITPCNPELARVSVTARVSQTQPGQTWTAWFRTDSQAAENLLALVHCQFEDWQTIIQQSEKPA